MEPESLCSAPMTTRIDRFDDEQTDTSSLSDYDSEWTQISGTEDESDFPHLTAYSDRPLSRTGTVDDSVDGDVWEGFVEEQSTHLHEEHERVYPSNAIIEGEGEQAPRSICTSPVATDDDRINKVLDCSVVSTLRASRARSLASSLHSSLTDSQSKLRLSFPDPLLRANDELILDSAPHTDASEFTDASDVLGNKLSIADDLPSLLSIEETVSHVDVTEAPEEFDEPTGIPENIQCILSIMLYGSASGVKWQAAEKVIKLILQCDTLSIVRDEGSTARWYTYEFYNINSVKDDKVPPYIRVVDRTSNSPDAIVSNELESPSLAIVLLPSRLPTVLPNHTFYLPLISPTSLDFGGTSEPVVYSTFSEQILRDSAQYTWGRLNVPRQKIVLPDVNRPDVIFDVSEMDGIDRHRLVAVFGKLVNTEKQYCQGVNSDPIRFIINKWYLIAFIAASLLAITAGARIRVLSRWSNSSLDFNSTETKIGVSTDVVTSLYKGASPRAEDLSELTLAASKAHLQTSVTRVNKAQTDLAMTSSVISNKGIPTIEQAMRAEDRDRPVTAVASTSSDSGSLMDCNCHSKCHSWSNTLSKSLIGRTPKDFITRQSNVIRPLLKVPSSFATLLSSEGTDKRMTFSPHRDIRLAKNTMKGIDKALSTWIMRDPVGLISNVGKAIMEVVGQDMKVLYDAIDELLRALGRQLQVAKADLQIVKDRFRNELIYRNERVKAKAKMIRSAGERFVKAATERLRNGKEEAVRMAEQARDTARRMKGDAAKSRNSRRQKRERARKTKKKESKHRSSSGSKSM